MFNISPAELNRIADRERKAHWDRKRMQAQEDIRLDANRLWANVARTPYAMQDEI